MGVNLRKPPLKKTITSNNLSSINYDSLRIDEVPATVQPNTTCLGICFDTLDHDTLLSCLSVRFGFAGSVLKWFGSYLHYRFQSVKIGSAVSDLFKLKFDVPQGPVSGLLLFSLCTTPISQIIRKYTGAKYHIFG